MTQVEKTLEQVIAEFMQATEAVDAQTPVEDQQGHLEELKKTTLAAHPEFGDELIEFFTMHSTLCNDSRSAAEVTGESSDSLVLDHIPSANDSSLLNSLPRILGDYEILEEIDRGGMGIVFKARHQKLDRIVALKLIRSGELASEQEVERFFSEARAAAALSHSGIVQIYEVGTWNGLVFYTMEYIEGKSLAESLQDGPLDPMDAARIVRKLCGAVEFAHRSGVYHRDLKPANVLINEKGEPVIIDFGLAKNVHQDQSLTATGQILGTPAYMAPEHASGRVKEVGSSADVYALGAILYCLCAGQPAFSGPTPFDVLLQVLDRRPARPSKFNRKVTRSLDFICLRMLEKNPSERYRSLREFAADLQHVLAGEPIDLPQESAVQQIQKWWQREPSLASHVAGIGTTLIIVVLAYWMREEKSILFSYRVALLVAWMVVSALLQYCVNLEKWRHAAIYTWLGLDTFMITTLIAFASPPRAMLLIGYPMLLVASSLFYQRRFVITTTITSILGLLILAWQFPKEDFTKPDFTSIFLSGLVVVALCLLAMIRRIRGLSQFYEAE